MSPFDRSYNPGTRGREAPGTQEAFTSEPAAPRRRPKARKRKPAPKTGAPVASRSRTAGKAGAKARRLAPAEKVTASRREVSAGGVVYRRTRKGPKIALAARRTQKGELVWGLPKGQIEPGETQEQAAVREVREETGLDAKIEASLGTTRYFYVWDGVRVRKAVHFFLMRHTGGQIGERDHEMEDVQWFPLAAALKAAAYRGERGVLARAAELLS